MQLKNNLTLKLSTKIVVKFEEKLPVIHIKNVFWLKEKKDSFPCLPTN
jgi:hypothetical protein